MEGRRDDDGLVLRKEEVRVLRGRRERVRILCVCVCV